MEHLGTMSVFVQAAELGSFVAAGRQTGLSASAVGKAIVRLEKKLGVRLFHRNTRSIALTAEGKLFLERCRRIFEEIEAAEMELTKANVEPTGRLRVSLPLTGMLLTPVIAGFMKSYPDIVLDLDYSDRFVDVIEEGFDVVIRASDLTDSRLMRKSFGHFSGKVVASAEYIKKNGTPKTPLELKDHKCLRQRSPNNGKLHDWDFKTKKKLNIPETMSATNIDPIIYLVERGFGIAFLPPFAVAPQIKRGTLISILDKHVEETGEMAALWPASRQLSPKIRVFIDFLAANLKINEGKN